MRRSIVTSLTVLALWGSIGLNFATAQFGSLGQAPPRTRPTVSPFINLGQGGAGAFYGIIKPQLDANRSINDLQQGLQRLNPDGSLQGQLNQGHINAQTGLQTGHAASFFNYSHYYPLTPGGASSGGTTGLGAGLGSPGFGVGTGGIGNTGVRPFFGANMNQGMIR